MAVMEDIIKQKIPLGATKKKKATKEKTELLPRFNIVYHNNDKTTVDFVMDTLVLFLRHTEQSAYDKAMEIHKEGRAITFTESFEVCELKYQQVNEFCKDYGEKHLKIEIQRGAK